MSLPDSNSLLIREEWAGDQAAIEHVHTLAFAGRDEAQLVDALRAGGHSMLSLLALAGEQVIGHLLFSRIQVYTPEGVLAALSLAPLGVLPQWQRRGVGSSLMRRGIAICRQRGERFILVLGDPGYYGRFGFTSDAASRLECAYAGPHLQGLLLGDAVEPLTGRVEYSPPFAGL